MRNRLLFLAFTTCSCWAGRVTYRVTENAGACVEVRIPKWTRPETGDEGPWPVSSWGCEYDMRSKGGSQIYIGLSCGSVSYWRMKEHYAVDLNHSKDVRRIENDRWDAAPVLEPEAYNDGGAAKIQPEGLEYKDHFFAKSGANWDMYGKALASPGRSRMAVYSYEGIVERSYDFSFAPQHFEGTYWTEIYDVASAKRLVQIRGDFHGVDLTEFQGKSVWLGGRFFLQPLAVNGMRRVLICDIDSAARSTGVAESDAPLPLALAKPYLQYSRSYYQLRFLETRDPQAHITGFRDESVLCPASNDIGSIKVTALLDVATPGTYWLRLTLKDQSGSSIEESAGAEVHAGKDELTVSFPGHLLRLLLKSDGPYTITSGQLTRQVIDGQFWVENVDGQVTTQPYSLPRIKTRCP